ncbi:hypothetical protein GUITHDRAFT_112397 [Guillardia theta CCMP2712]|uniref:Uncharacterized protein n=1 Tax=Guillardia theta (strain CCMP2712) TaxID=905079 RepID=L1J0S2_GUITC|nr:hypothetical protein GUITHDRAFT_112397 [Guillardia theta CCMP2712]EKX41690.1 hypothetical protein GUITHDRAFT_112397 [Guillardia theta CCMP2712]|eukprot:XP_005828670.1 hypothetical protein GUITHDRAFT_112397 [Guillardia theta CCMP2712]
MTGARKGEDLQQLEDAFKAVLHCAAKDDDDWVKLTGTLMSDIVSANRIRLDKKQMDDIGTSLSNMLSTSEAKNSLKGITSLQKRFLSIDNRALDLSDENWKVSCIDTSHCLRKDREAREHSFSVSGQNAAFPKAITPRPRTEANWWEGTQRTTSVGIPRHTDILQVLVEEVDEENDKTTDEAQAPSGKRSRGKKNQNEEEGGKQKKHRVNDAASAGAEQALAKEGHVWRRNKRMRERKSERIAAEDSGSASKPESFSDAPASSSLHLKTVPGLIELVETSRHLNEGAKRAIIDFIRGVRVNPFPDQPPLLSFTLRSERLDGKIESILLEINYDTGSWKEFASASASAILIGFVGSPKLLRGQRMK